MGDGGTKAALEMLLKGGGLAIFIRIAISGCFIRLVTPGKKSHLRRVLKAERNPPLRCQPFPPRTPRTGFGFSEDHCVSRSL